jgi:hypothetical protein
MSPFPRYGPTPLVREAAGIFRLLGGMASRHLVVVGGLVPHLLVPDAADEHVGSADIDFCRTSSLRKAAFVGESARVSAGCLRIDFLAPLEEADATLSDGTLHLHDDIAAANAGATLRPYPIRSGGLIDADAIETTISDVDLFYMPGVASDVTIRHAGPVGFLAAKADALVGRHDSKDGYDVAWWCLNAARTPAEVAGLVIGRPGFRHPLVAECVHGLGQAFTAPHYDGPSGYAQQKFPREGPGEPEFDEARNRAFTATSSVVAILRENLWSDIG